MDKSYLKCFCLCFKCLESFYKKKKYKIKTVLLTSILILPVWLMKYAPDHFKTQEMCNEAMRSHPYILEYITDKLKTQDMYEGALKKVVGA